jgi:hypothetical protein
MFSSYSQSESYSYTVREGAHQSQSTEYEYFGVTFIYS